LDNATWTIANDCSIGHQYGTVRLVTPGLGKALHGCGSLEPALLGIDLWCGTLCGRSKARAEHE